MHSTTILCVKRYNETIIASDGQATVGSMVAKSTTCKVRKFKKGKIIAGFAGSVADCMTLLERLEKKIEQYENLERSCYELAKEWRTDKYIRNLEASIVVTDGNIILSLSGDGNVLQPEDKNIASVGSGSVFALSAARALYENTDLSAEEIVRKSMKIAGDLCIYTNHNLSIEKIVSKNDSQDNKGGDKSGEENEKNKMNKKINSAIVSNNKNKNSIKNNKKAKTK